MTRSRSSLAPLLAILLAATAPVAGAQEPGAEKPDGRPAPAASTAPAATDGAEAGVPPIEVVFVLYEGVELGDFSGPWEVFSVASEMTGGRFKLSLAAEREGVLTLHGGMRMLPDCTFDDCPTPDMLVVPGGQGVFAAMESPILIDYLRRASAGADQVVAICVGSFLLGKVGALDGHTVTTHDLGLGYLRQLVPAARVVDERWIDDGRLLSAGGVSAGVDLALHLVERRLGAEAARATAKHLDHPWEPSP